MDCCDNNKIKTKAKLLVIDDDGQTRMLIRDILKDTDISIIESDCGTEAFEIFKNNRVQIGLILLDIYLPGCDGWTLAGMIRKLNPTIPIIAISAMPPAELAVNCRLAGFDGYFSKPFEMNRLKEIIVSYLQASDNR